MLHSINFIRGQFMLASPMTVAAQLLTDLTKNPFRSPAARALALTRTCAALCRMHHIEARSRGSWPDEPVIFVANHLGYVDPLVVCSQVPCSPIAKAEVADWPIIGSVAQQMNVIFVERGNELSAARALKTAMHRLEAGVSILNFPEGTTTRGEMRSFRRGIFGLSMLMGVPVVPLALSFDSPELCWVDDDNLLGHYSRSMLGKTHRVDVGIGPKLRARAKESPADFAARVRTWIANARERSRRVKPITPIFELVRPAARAWSELGDHTTQKHTAEAQRQPPPSAL